ncbi:TPA: hypothetical protein QFC14_002682 [Enterococcus faecium]|uniref:hypothetical protein n=3 Tax=Enterococcus TaxID=1350 RepID=UPI001C611A21|nr:hypothetical protein [Enterococcus faecium]
MKVGNIIIMIFEYLKKMTNSKSFIFEKDLLLGYSPEKIVYFITFKDFYQDIDGSIKNLLENKKGIETKLILDGNLSDHLIFRMVQQAMTQHKKFSIVVNDGYHLNNSYYSDRIAALLISETVRVPG